MSSGILTMSKPPKDEEYDEAEAQRRFEQAVKGGLKTPPIHSEKSTEKQPAKKRRGN